MAYFDPADPYNRIARAIMERQRQEDADRAAAEAVVGTPEKPTGTLPAEFWDEAAQDGGGEIRRHPRAVRREAESPTSAENLATVGGVFKDLAREGLPSAAHGLVGAVDEYLETIGETMIGESGGFLLGPETAKRDPETFRKLLGTRQPETATGEGVAAISQITGGAALAWASGAAGAASKGLKTLAGPLTKRIPDKFMEGKAGKAAAAVGEATVGKAAMAFAAADYAAFPAEEKRMLVMMNEIPGVADVIPDWLASDDPHDPEWRQRFERAVEGHLIGAALELGFRASLAFVKAKRAGQPNELLDAPNKQRVEDALETKAVDDFEQSVQEIEQGLMQPEVAQGRLAELQALKDEVDRTLEPDEIVRIKDSLRPTVETLVKAAEDVAGIEGVDTGTLNRVVTGAQKLHDLVEVEDVVDPDAGLTPELMETIKVARETADSVANDLDLLRPEIQRPALAGTVDQSVKELRTIRDTLPEVVSPRNRKELQQSIEAMRAELDPIDVLREQPTVARTIEFFRRPLVMARRVRLEDVRDVLALGHEAANRTGIARFGTDADRLAFESAGRDAWDRLREWESNPQNADRAHRAVQAADHYRKAFRRQTENTRLGRIERVETPDEIRARGGLSRAEAKELQELEARDSFASWDKERMAALRAKRDMAEKAPLGQPEVPPSEARAAAEAALTRPAATRGVQAVRGLTDVEEQELEALVAQDKLTVRDQIRKRELELWKERNLPTGIRSELNDLEAELEDMKATGASVDEIERQQFQIDRLLGKESAPSKEIADAVPIAPRVAELQDELDQMRTEGADEDLIKQIEDELERARAEEDAALDDVPVPPVPDDVPVPPVREQRGGLDRPPQEMMVGLRNLARSFVGARFGQEAGSFSDALDQIGWEDKVARFVDDMYRAAADHLYEDDPYPLLDKVVYGLQRRIREAGVAEGRPLTEGQLDLIAKETIADVMPGMKGTGRAKERAVQEMEAAFGRLQRGAPRRDPVHSSGVPDATLNELRTMAIRIFGHKLHVEELTNAGDVTGQFDTTYNIARVALLGRGAPAAFQTLGHEGIHFLRQWKGFTDPEWDTLVRVAKRDWMKKYDIAKKYEGAGLTQDQLIEEAIAEGLGDILAGVGKAPRGVKGIANKIRKLLDRFAAKMRGAPTLEDVVRRLESGEIGREMDAKDFSQMLEPAAVGDIRAVHGSGQLFRAFLDAFVNTGEGSQVEGWGHYFTRSRAAGQQYKQARELDKMSQEALSLESLQLRMEDELPGPWSNEAAMRIMPQEHSEAVNVAFEEISHAVHDLIQLGHTGLEDFEELLTPIVSKLRDVAPELTDDLPSALDLSRYADRVWDDRKRAFLTRDKGHLYTVDLVGVNNRLIDFRTGFAGQPQAVQDGIRAAYQEAGAEDLLDALIKNPKANGKDIYRGLAFRYGDVAPSLQEMESVRGAGHEWMEAQHKASKLLLKHGVEGNTFFDEGMGVDNFVLFSGDRARILLREQRRVERGRGEAHEAALRYLDGLAEDRHTWSGYTDEQRARIEEDDPELAEIWGSEADEVMEEGYGKLAAVLGTGRANEVVHKLRALKAKDYRAEMERGGRAAERVRQDIDGVLGAIREQRGRGTQIEGDEGVGAVRTRAGDTRAGRLDLASALHATRDLGRRSVETGPTDPRGGPLLTEPLRDPDEVRAGEPPDFGAEKGDVHLARQRPARVKNLPPNEAYGRDTVPKRPNVRLENVRTADDFGALLAESMQRAAATGGIARTSLEGVTHRDAVEGMIQSKFDPKFKLRKDIDPAVLSVRRGAAGRVRGAGQVWSGVLKDTDIDPRGRGGRANAAKLAARVDQAVLQTLDDTANTVHRLAMAAADNQADSAAAAAFARSVHKLHGMVKWLGGDVQGAEDSLRRAALDVKPEDANAKILIRRGNHGLIKQSGGIQALRGTADGITNAKNTSDVFGYLKRWEQQTGNAWSVARGLGLHRSVDTALAIQYSNQLSGAGTQTENGASGVMMMALRIGEGAAQGAFGGEFADAALVGSPKAAAARRLATVLSTLPAGFKQGFKLARIHFGREMRLQLGIGDVVAMQNRADAEIEKLGLKRMYDAAARHSDSEVAMDGERYGIPTGLKELAGDGMMRQVVEALSGSLGLTISTTQTVMKSLDILVKHASQTAQLHHDASTIALREGLRGDDYVKRVTEMVNHPSRQLMERARTVGELNTFQEDPGKYTAAFIGFMDKHPALRLMLPMPYIRSVMNVLRQANEYALAAPANALTGNKIPVLRRFMEQADRLSKAGSVEQVSRMRGKAMMGFAAWTVIGAWAYNGNLTGGSPANSRLAATRRSLGIPDYSIKIPGTDKWIQYKNWGIFGFMLGAVADGMEVVQAATGREELEAAGVAAGLVSVYLGLAMRESTLDNVVQLTEFQDNPALAGQFLSRYVADKIVGGTIPIGAGTMARSIDRLQIEGAFGEYDASTGTGGPDEEFLEQLGEEILQALGVWRHNTWLLGKDGERFPRVNGFGDPVGNPYLPIGEDEGASGGRWTMVMSSFSQSKLMSQDTSPEAELVLDLDYAIPKVPNEILVKEPGEGDGGFKRIIEFPRASEEYYFYARGTGKMFREAVKALMQTEGFKNQMDDWKVGGSQAARQAIKDELGRLWATSREMTERAMVVRFPGIQDRMVDTGKDLLRKRDVVNRRTAAGNAVQIPGF